MQATIPSTRLSHPLKTLRREGISLLLVVVLFIVIVGPMLTVVLWAFAERWRYPSLIPTQWGFQFWADTLSRAQQERQLTRSRCSRLQCRGSF